MSIITKLLSRNIISTSDSILSRRESSDNEINVMETESILSTVGTTDDSIPNDSIETASAENSENNESCDDIVGTISVEESDHGNNNNDVMGMVAESFTHITHAIHCRPPFMHGLGLKKCIGAVALLIASIFATEEVGDEFFRHYADQNLPNDGPETRIELVTSCASKLSKQVGSDMRVFNGGATPQLRAIDWFVDGPGQKIPINNGCPKEDGLFQTLYSLMVTDFSLTIGWSKEKNDFVSTMSQVCHWRRIGCDDHYQFITRLHLSDIGTNNTGTLPSEISLLRHLERLEIYDNHGLAGTIPPSISSMLSLEYLYIQHTSIGGTVPASMASLTNLKELFMEDTKLHGSVPLQVCSLKTKGSLRLLHTDCAGNMPMIKCSQPLCCTNCYYHHDMTMISSAIASV